MFAHAIIISLPCDVISPMTGAIGFTGVSGVSNITPLNASLARITALRSEFATNALTQETEAPSVTDESMDSQERSSSAYQEATNDDSSSSLPSYGVPVTRYYPPEELSRRARALRDIDLSLGRLQELPGSGKAILTLWINDHGTVDHVETLSSSLDKVFEGAVISQFKTVHFKPAERDGVPVNSLMKIEVELFPR